MLHIIEHSVSSRDRIFTPLKTLKTFIFQVLSTDGSCRQAVSHVLSERLHQGCSANSIKTGSYCKARKRLPLKQLKQVTEESGTALHHKAHPSWCWKGHNTLVTDGTTVLMQDTPENQAVFPQQTNQKPGLGFPILRIVGLISLSVGSVVSYTLGPYQGKGSGETSLFSQMISAITQDDLLLADRYYCTWAIIALILQQGAHMLLLNHAQRKPDWIKKIDYDALPDEILFREFSVRGKVYVTTLLDEKKYHKKELAEFYTQRWLVELDFRSIKTHMKMDMLRCKSPDRVQKEIAVHLLAYNLIRASIARAATAKGKTPRHLSFMTAVQLFNEGITLMMLLSGRLLKQAVNGLLDAIASISIGRQKRKKQPRAIKRRPKPYPLLTIPRVHACEAIN